MNMTTEPSTDQTTSTPTNITKQMVISLDATNQLNFTISDTWTIHEAFGVLLLTGLNLYSNNLSPMRGVQEKLDLILQRTTTMTPGVSDSVSPSMSDLLMAAAEQLKNVNG